MLTSANKYWHIFLGLFAGLLGVLSLFFDMYPQFPSMCIILGIILAILIDTMDTVPPIQTYHWHILWDDIKMQKVAIWRGFLLLQSKIIFPTLFTIYLLLLIMEKVTIVPEEWQSYASAAIETLQLLWVTLVSAVLANFSGVKEEQYQVKKHSPLAIIITLLIICALSYFGMWSVFAEIAVIGRVSYFVALSVGILIALVSMMILTEEDIQDA